jgi:mannose-6-phosphate isomerase-like protein (cupin superfamily)
MRVVTPVTALVLATTTVAAAGAPELDAVVGRVVRQHYRALHRCYRGALAGDRTRGGTLFVRATLGRADRVVDARVERDELKHAAVAQCVARLVRRWRLEGAASAGADAGSEVVIPVSFQPDPNQFVVRVEDVTPRAIPGGTDQPLLQPANVGAKRATLSLLTVTKTVHLPGQPHDQALFVLRGRGRIRSGSGWRDRIADGTASWIAPGVEVWIHARRRVELLHLTVPAKGAVTSPRRGPPRVTDRRRSPRLLLPGGVEVIPLLDQRTLGHRRFYLGLLGARRGVKVPRHAHSTEAELLYLRRGRGLTTLGHAVSSTGKGAQTREVGRGQAVYLPAGFEHELEVRQGLWVVQVYAPAGPEQRFFKAAATAGRILDNDAPRPREKSHGRPGMGRGKRVSSQGEGKREAAPGR